MLKSGHTYPVAQKTNRLTLVVPEIKREYMENGVRYYETEGGRIFDANIYDSKLTPTKMAILPKHIPIGGSREGGRSLRLIAMQNRIPKPVVVSKKCITCEEEKLIRQFHKAPNSKDGYRNECKECANEKTRANARKREDSERF